jgi:putative transposase
VQKDRTVSLEGVAFEVDAALVGERVLVRYDAGKARDERVVEVWYRGRRAEIERRVDVHDNCFVKRNATTRAIQFQKAAPDYELRGCPCASWSTLPTTLRRR